MMKSRPTTLMGLLVALLLVACGGGAATTTTEVDLVTTAPPAAETTAPAATGAEVMVATSDLGDILTDAEGMTLYMFVPDAQGDPTCYDECAATWPAFTGAVTAGAGLDAALLGTVARTDGGEQVTYNSHPLYYFANDAAPGDTNGQGLNDIWWVVGPDGEPIQ